MDVIIRAATAQDTAAIAALHADNWRLHYRGAYSDAYLDGDLDADRLTVWTERLGQPDRARSHGAHFTVAALSDEGLVGFGHVVLDADPVFGALVDNLHVRNPLRGAGVGTRLLAAVAAELARRRPDSGLYLWVLEQNTAAQAFYRARGGTLSDRCPAGAPHGRPENLNGTPAKWRVSWPDPSALCS